MSKAPAEIGVRCIHAREQQKGPVRAIVERDLFLSARSSFFFLPSAHSSFSHPESCLKIEIVVGKKKDVSGGPGRRGGGGERGGRE